VSLSISSERIRPPIKYSGTDFDLSFLWLLLPWAVAIGMFIASALKLDAWLGTLPYGLGNLALKNMAWGLFILIVGSSARWAYLRCSKFGYVRLELYVRVAGLTVLITMVQIGGPILFLIVLWLLVGFRLH